MHLNIYFYYIFVRQSALSVLLNTKLQLLGKWLFHEHLQSQIQFQLPKTSASGSASNLFD